MLSHTDINDENLRSRIKNRLVGVAGNKKLKIYGTLNCSSGKRMKRQNRVFFSSAGDAIEHGYRPCGNCMKKEYLEYRNGSV